MEWMDTLAKIGTRIFQVRKRLRMSQASFGRHLDLSGNAISSYETGDAIPTVRTIVKIAEIGNVTIQWLIMGDEKEPKLSSEDLLMLSVFHQLPPDEREAAIRILEVLASRNNQKKAGK